MSLHKHHLLQVQEQIVFFQKGSRAAAPPRLGSERDAGIRAGLAELALPGVRRLFAAWPGLPAHSPTLSRAWELLNALPSQETHVRLITPSPSPGRQAQPPTRWPPEALLVGLLSRARACRGKRQLLLQWLLFILNFFVFYFFGRVCLVLRSAGPCATGRQPVPARHRTGTSL